MEYLYKHGATRDQLPNLKALADYMGAGYVKVHPGNMALKSAAVQLGHFDVIIEESND